MDFIAEVEEIEVEFKWINRYTYGDCDIPDEKMRINIWLILAEIFIHETLHIENPDWNEKKVGKMTEYEVERMKTKDIKFLGVKLLILLDMDLEKILYGGNE